MGKRISIFAGIILVMIPVLTVGLTFGRIFIFGQRAADDAREAFFRQSTDGYNVLLADKEGTAIMVCLLEGDSTHLVSILPSSCPRGEKNTTFLAVYQKEGIVGLKEKVSQSLSCTLSGSLEVDFSGLGAVVDALDGIEMNGKTYSGQALKTYLHSLPTDSAGAQAQQEVVLAVGRRFCSAGFWKGQNGLGKLLRIADTDFSVTALMKIGKKLIPALSGTGLYRYCLPEQGNWEIPGKNKPFVEIVALAEKRRMA